MAKAHNTLLCAVTQAARGKIAVSGVPNSINYYVIFMIQEQDTNVPAGRVTQPGRPRAVRRPRFGYP